METSVENASQPPKKTRTRSKSVTGENTALSSEEEMAPNLNGNKDGGGGNETDSASENKQEKQEQHHENPKTRKRKAMEMKLDEEPPEETPATPEDDDAKEKEVIKEAHKETSDESPSITDVHPEDESSTNDSTSDLKDIVVPEKNLLGKGKRARIPNKRYSDIPAKYESPKSKSTENGQLQDTETTEILKEEAESDSGSASYSSKRSASSPSGGDKSNKKLKPNVDLNNPNYLKPFQFGWKRELVYRANNDNTLKRNGDIYYYTPSGKKVRSMREVAENLKNKELSIDDFTFFKEPLGIEDPEKEIIRDAKLKTTTVIPKKMTPKMAKTPKVTSPKASPTAPATTASETPKVAKSPRVTPGFKVKIPKGSSSKKEKKPKEDTDMEIGTYPPNWSGKKGKGNNFTDVDNKPCQPCSIRCEGVTGLIPTLQCRLCLCLYHNECVGIQPRVNIQGYVCKNCQLEQDPNSGATSHITPPPPLTPVNSLKPVQTGVLPKLQRIPKTESTQTSQSNDTSKQNSKTVNTTPATTTQTAPQSENKSLLGSVTTWFPPSSTIKMGNNESTNSENATQDPPRPQLVEFVGNRKYLIVPRHNILSVASGTPNISPPSEVNVPNLNPDNVCDIKVEPESPSKYNDKPLDVNSDPLALTPPSNLLADATEHLEPNEETMRLHLTANQEKMVETPKSRTLRGRKAPEKEEKEDSGKFMETYLQNLAFGYKTLLYVFQYLKVQDLLRAGCVCQMWRDVSRHPLLWSTVRMKNSQIHSFEGLANALEQHGTVHLDLRKMLLPTNGGDDIWPSFTQAIKKVESLRKIELCRCLASVVEDLARNNHNLEVINAVTIKCESMTFEPFKNLKNLTDLRLKSTAGLTLTSDLSALKELTNLRHLSITSIKDLNKLNIEVIGELVNLEVLDIGECSDFPLHFGPEILSRLVKLEKLRLEKGQGECYTFEMLDAVKDLQNLYQLELVNFDIKPGFDRALGACLNIKKLLIIPTYISQSATTNHMVLGGVLKLQKTLSQFVWGVTLELLRVTELFVDQCEQPDKKDVSKDKNPNNGDSIPVLKPVPLHGVPIPEAAVSSDTPQVEILPLPTLQKLLLQNLPTTRVKILKIPFHATWRQSITDSVN